MVCLEPRRRCARAGLMVATVVAAICLLSSHPRPNKHTFIGGALAQGSMGMGDGARRAAESVNRRGGCIARRAVGLMYATQTGNTETVAGLIAEKADLVAVDIADLSAEGLAGFDGLIVGCPTWNTGADEYRSGTSWDDLLDDIKGLSLAGKPIAVFGCGDSQGYADNFCDGIEELHETFKAAGGKMVGYVDASGYQHSESKSVRDGKFLGLPLDEDNENDMTDDRIQAWLSQIKAEGMPL